MITTINGTNENLGDVNDFRYLIEKYMNRECLDFFDTLIDTYEDDIDLLEHDIEELNETVNGLVGY